MMLVFTAEFIFALNRTPALSWAVVWVSTCTSTTLALRVPAARTNDRGPRQGEEGTDRSVPSGDAVLRDQMAQRLAGWDFPTELVVGEGGHDFGAWRDAFAPALARLINLVVAPSGR